MQGEKNLSHALDGDCKDPDCELHHPEVIEDEDQKLTALAWFYIGFQNGAAATVDMAENAVENVREEILDHANWRYRPVPRVHPGDGHAS